MNTGVVEAIITPDDALNRSLKDRDCPTYLGRLMPLNVVIEDPICEHDAIGIFALLDTGLCSAVKRIEREDGSVFSEALR